MRFALTRSVRFKIHFRGDDNVVGKNVVERSGGRARLVRSPYIKRKGVKETLSGQLGPSASAGIPRRQFLKLGGAELTGAVVVGGGLTGAGRALAQGENAGPLRREFEAAAKEYGVPVAVLLAMGHVNTRWEMPAPEVNAYRKGEPEGKGAYGVMALVRNPTTDTLGEAAALSGIPEARLKADCASNIRGGAVLLAEASGVDLTGATDRFSGTVTGAADDLNALDPDSVESFTDTVSGAVDGLTKSVQAVSEGISGGTAVAGVGGGELYAQQVRDTLRSGAVETISSGERISLTPAGR